MLAAARVGARAGVGDPRLEARLTAVLPRLGLPTDLDSWLRPEVLGRVAVDKKRSGASLRYVVVPEVGKATTLELAPERLLEMLLDEKNR
jgi:3-dehydroquinate synthetase